jgi:hypothetical protein
MPVRHRVLFAPITAVHCVCFLIQVCALIARFSSVVDAIYQDVPGAKFYNDTIVGPIYTLPCDQEIDLTFYFDGQPYPVHPLDTNMDGSQLGLKDNNGIPVCIGAVRVSHPLHPFVAALISHRSSNPSRLTPHSAVVKHQTLT